MASLRSKIPASSLPDWVRKCRPAWPIVMPVLAVYMATAYTFGTVYVGFKELLPEIKDNYKRVWKIATYQVDMDK